MWERQTERKLKKDVGVRRAVGRQWVRRSLQLWEKLVESETKGGAVISHKAVWIIPNGILPVACGRYEVYAAVHPGVWDPLLPVDVDFLLQVGFILVVDELHNGQPADKRHRVQEWEANFVLTHGPNLWLTALQSTQQQLKNDRLWFNTELCSATLYYVFRKTASCQEYL